MTLARYLGLVVAGFAMAYVTIFILSFFLFRESGNSLDVVDTESANNIYANTSAYYLFNLDRLALPGPRVIVVGASAAAWGFRPRELAPLVSRRVDNIAIYSSNLVETAQTIDLAYSYIPRSDWSKTIFVLGIWYGQFASDAKEWPSGRTDIDQQGLRYGLYRNDGLGRITPRWGKRITSLLAPTLRPAILFEKFYHDLISVGPITKLRSSGGGAAVKELSVEFKEFIAEYEADSQKAALVTGPSQRIIALARKYSGKLLISIVRPKKEVVTLRDPPPFKEVGQRNIFTLNAVEREASIANWKIYMGPPAGWDNGSFKNLLAIAQNVSQHGSHLLILDLPIPSWHRRSVPYDSEYHRRLALLKPKLENMPNVEMATMSGLFVDDDFFDAVHPRPRVSPKWAQIAADFIRHMPNK